MVAVATPREPSFISDSSSESSKLRPRSLQLALSWLHFGELADTGKIVMAAKKRPPTSPEQTTIREKVLQHPRKRFSLFKPKPASSPKPDVVLDLGNSKPSILAALRKLLSRSSKKRVQPINKKAASDPSLCSKASCLYDEDDGTLDDATLQISVGLYEGGLPSELINSPLRVTYINSVRKLQVRNHRPLHQLLLINSVVSRLQVHVADKALLFDTHSILPLSRLDSPRDYRARPVLPRRLSSASRRNHSEPDLTHPPISPTTEKKLHRLSDPYN